MGNCSPKLIPQFQSPKPSSPPSPPTIHLHGSQTSLPSWRLRLQLLYRPASIVFVESGSAQPPFLRCGAETINGSEASLLRYVDKRFGGVGKGVAEGGEGRGAAEVMVIQHRSIRRHVEGMARWAEKMVKEGGDGWKGRAAEGRLMGKFYGELVEIMLEHAQMEERFLFPALQRTADYDVCRRANEEHGRDLPLMNGIKEDIKSLIAMDVGGPLYQEALLNLSSRFKTLQEHCKQHFQEEEKELLPLLEAAENVRRNEGEEPWPQSRWVQQMVDLMEQAHSRLLAFFVASLFPHEAVHYVSLIAGGDDQRAINTLRSIVASFETSPRPSWLHKGCN